MLSVSDAIGFIAHGPQMGPVASISLSSTCAHGRLDCACRHFDPLRHPVDNWIIAKGRLGPSAIHRRPMRRLRCCFQTTSSLIEAAESISSSAETMSPNVLHVLHTVTPSAQKHGLFQKLIPQKAPHEDPFIVSSEGPQNILGTA